MFTTTKRDLKRAIAEAWQVVEARNTIPVLGCFLLDLGPEPTITATNLDQRIDVQFAASPNQTIEHFNACIPAKALKDIVGKLAEGEVTITQGEDDGVIVQSGNLKAKLKGYPVSDFPTLREFKKPCKFSLDGSVFHKMFNKTNPQVSTEETRYYLNGVLMTIAGGRLVTVATNGHRLARVTTRLPDGAKGIPAVIIPRIAARLAERHSKGHDTPIDLEVSENGVIFYFEGVSLQTKVIDGTFPDFERVIPTPGDRQAEFKTAELLDVVKRLVAFQSRGTHGLVLDISRVEATLSFKAPEIGLISETVPAELVGDPIIFGFNAGYFASILSSIDGENVRIYFTDIHGPALIEDLDDWEVTFVLMPMRV